ncbi:glycosyltransferase family 4 protein [Roseomonas sp. BN140053]|uniref:glycosyltransferase family 4 protein n=1 Tax=Roseomonas sp. BN140053 TaxID=3391898 RepID=UPI0039EA62A9
MTEATEFDILGDIKEDEQGTAVSRATGFSLCRYSEDSRTLTVRGWIADGEGVVELRFLAPGGRLLGQAVLSETRIDVLRRYGTTNQVPNGFRVSLECGLRVGDQVMVEFVAEDGRLLGSRAARASEAEIFAVESLEYDTASKQLSYEGYFVPGRQIRGMSITLSRGRTEAVDEMFVHRKDIGQRITNGANLYAGFRGRVFHAGQGDLKAATLIAHYVNGEDRSFPLPIENTVYDAPRAVIEKLEINWLVGKFRLHGWFRAFQEVTRIDISVAGQLCHSIPVINSSDAVMKQQRFKGPIAREFTIEARLEDAFENLGLLCSATSPEVSISLYNRTSLLLEQVQAARDTVVQKASLSYSAFDRRNSVLALQGCYVGAARPCSLQVLCNGVAVGQPLAVQASADHGAMMPGVQAGEWSWMYDINGVVTASTRISVRLFDENGLLLGEADAPTLRPTVVSGHEVVEGLDVEAQAAAQHAHNFARRPLPPNTVLFTLQGSITLFYGGGAVRLLDLMRFFHNAGYTVMLVDRTAPWEIARRPAVYREMREYVDHHLMIPQLIKSQMLALSIAEMERKPDADLHDRKLIDKLKEVQKKGRLMSADSKALAERADTHFNYMCTALANHFSPRLAISSYVWSAEFHQGLRPGIYGMIDTVDMQVMRYESFCDAHARFGPAAVPNLEKYALSEAEELRFLSLAQGFIAISRQERDWLASRLGAHRVVAAGVSVTAPVAPVQRRNSGRAHPIVLFVGNLYEPNTFSLRRFVQEQWAGVTEAVPGAKLVVCGRVGEGLQDLADPSIELTGIVDSLADLYQRATIAINPVLFGSGLPVKTVEGLSNGKAVVCTEFGARGLEDAVACGALIVTPFETIGERIIQMLKDPGGRRAVEEAAKTFVRNSLSPETVMADLMNFVESRIFYNPA